MKPLTLTYFTLAVITTICACSSSGDESGDDDASGVGGNGAGGTSPGLNGLGGNGSLGTSTSSGGTSPSSLTTACAAQTADAERRPVFLAFAFDVSGSMGKLDYAWHDPALKWQPVVDATEAFFADADSVGISASLTFFPGESSICEASTYASPDVAMTTLPSTAFADAITAITPQTSDDWRGGTPTLAVVQGVFGQLAQVATDNPEASIAVVLVTDGYPQGCDDNDVALVETEVAAHPNFLTYVIGVENPPIDGAPDTVSNLNGIAASGGTDAAFLIATGDPTATAQQLASVIDSIRGNSISCELTIPEPPAGETLDKNLVNVTYTSGTTSTPFVYDAACTTANAWHYDDATNPTAVVLCPNDCTTVMADTNANVVIEFGCEQRTTDIQ